MHQLSLITDAAPLLPVEAPSLPRPGAALLDSVGLVIGQIPKVGHARGTYRERLQGPLAYLYFRPDLVADDVERMALFDVAERTTGDVLRGHFEHDLRGPPDPARGAAPGWWVRLNGERARGMYSDGRRAMRPAAAAHPDDAAWCLSLVQGIPERFAAIADDYFGRIHGGAMTMDCLVQGMTRPNLLARSIHQFVLASLWTPSLASVFAAWVELAREAEPLSEDWTVTVDLAETQGKPWAEGVALLGRRSEQDPIRRALAWAVDDQRRSAQLAEREAEKRRRARADLALAAALKDGDA